MSDLETRFKAASEESTKLPKRPDQSTLLKLYALYKQGAEGDVTGKQPGFSDLVGRAKFDAWAKFKGTPKEEAMQQYIDLVDSLKRGQGQA